MTTDPTDTHPQDEARSPYAPQIDDDEAPPPPVDQKIEGLLDDRVALQAPADAETAQVSRALISSPALAIWFDERVFSRAAKIAGSLAKAVGIVPNHLIGKPQTCFFIVEQALTWRMSPSYVARNCYSTPGGKIGYHGALCQAVIECSGRIVGGVTYDHRGDWSKVQGKFRLAKSPKGRDYPVPTYTEKDEEGLSVIVRAQIKGEAAPRELELQLRQCFPRNSTLWATDPKRQVCYTAVRAFSNLAVPGIFAGMPFDHENEFDDSLVDVTPPRPDAAAYLNGSGDEQQPATATAKGTPAQKPSVPEYVVVNFDGEIQSFKKANEASSFLEKELRSAAGRGAKDLDGIWESNGEFLGQLREAKKEETADMLASVYTGLLKTLAGTRAPTPAAHAAVKWQERESDYYKKRPASPLQPGGSWIVFGPWLVEQAVKLPVEEVSDFSATFKAEIAALAKRIDPVTKIAEDHKKLLDVLGSRKPAA